MPVDVLAKGDVILLRETVVPIIMTLGLSLFLFLIVFK